MKKNFFLTCTLLALVVAKSYCESNSLPGVGLQTAEYFDSYDRQVQAESKAKQEKELILHNDPAFFTGKHYDQDLGAYIFKYRNYSPEINRWTTADPSGFPDGPNNYAYAPVPTSELDDTGLAVYTTSVNDVSGQVKNQLDPLVQSTLSQISSFVSTTAANLMSAGSYTYAYWSVMSFSISGTASATFSSTTAWGLINVPLSASYSLPSGLQPDPMSGTIGKYSGSNSVSQFNSNNNFDSKGDFNAHFNPALKVDSTKEVAGQKIYVSISDAQMSYSITSNASFYIYLAAE